MTQNIKLKLTREQADVLDECCVNTENLWQIKGSRIHDMIYGQAYTDGEYMFFADDQANQKNFLYYMGAESSKMQAKSHGISVYEGVGEGRLSMYMDDEDDGEEEQATSKNIKVDLEIDEGEEDEDTDFAGWSPEVSLMDDSKFAPDKASFKTAIEEIVAGVNAHFDVVQKLCEAEDEPELAGLIENNRRLAIVKAVNALLEEVLNNANIELANKS